MLTAFTAGGLDDGSALQVGTPAVRLQLLRRFELRRDGEPVPLPESAQRLVAFLAVRHRPQHRSTVAGTLWMDTTEEKAGANLRTALWRARRADPRLVACEGAYLSIDPQVHVDAAEVARHVRALLDHADEDPAGAAASGHALVDDLFDGGVGDPADVLSSELLPDWYDDWVLLERERLRQIRLHGLEALCVRLAQLGHHLEAIETGMLAAAAEPLRESAHRVLILAHLAEGNVAEAVRQYDRFAVLLDETLGIAPTESLRALLAPCR